eukprot:jgi/Botrbrau1/10394/Bobra.0133s0003.1
MYNNGSIAVFLESTVPGIPNVVKHAYATPVSTSTEDKVEDNESERSLLVTDAHHFKVPLPQPQSGTHRHITECYKIRAIVFFSKDSVPILNTAWKIEETEVEGKNITTQSSYFDEQGSYSLFRDFDVHVLPPVEKESNLVQAKSEKPCEVNAVLHIRNACESGLELLLRAWSGCVFNYTD